MSDVIIRVKNISKVYKIDSYYNGSLRQSITNISKIGSSSKKSAVFTALEDISFELKTGDVLGIIGRNGAGKSTLLKLLSRITHPSKGAIEITGRLASLLEVGTGFHPELTGRENIFLNGSILGMKQKEIRSRFEEIVEFAGVSNFLDTPVKHYSSGMYVRLAFSVAAHLEPEILIIDEILAVGDADFQKKCLGKLRSVSQSGRTAIFVSHNMSSLSSLCNKILWLEKGKHKAFGESLKIITDYLNPSESDFLTQKSWLINSTCNKNDNVVIPKSIEIIDLNSKNLKIIKREEGFAIRINFEILDPKFDPIPVIIFKTLKGETAFTSICDKKNSDCCYTLYIPKNFLNEGIYTVELNIVSYLSSTLIHFKDEEVLYFEVIENYELRTHPDRNTMNGALKPDLIWK